MVTYNVHSTFMYIITILYISEQKGQKSSSYFLTPTTTAPPSQSTTWS